VNARRLSQHIAICVVTVAAASLTRSLHVISASPREQVELSRVPGGGLQPRAVVDRAGTVHVTYFGGEPSHGDVFYTRLVDGRFAAGVRVNSQAGSAIATGNVRGPSLALGRNGRVHVAWLGSDRAAPNGDTAPMLYTRARPDGTFEPERNVHQNPGPIDGGSIAADANGSVYIAWHSEFPGSKGEANRRAWVTRSIDDGTTFEHEVAVSPAEAGACGCCGTATFLDTRGTLSLLFRAARDTAHREAMLLTSPDRGTTFTPRALQDWEISACPMSTFAVAEGDGATVAAWETAGQVYWTRVDGAGTGRPIAAPGSASGRKHPSIARNARGATLLAWTEGMGWGRGGTLAWQIFDKAGVPVGDAGHADGVPAWSLVAADAKPDGTFDIIY
jgi:hypothetical protein